MPMVMKKKKKQKMQTMLLTLLLFKFCNHNSTLNVGSEIMFMPFLPTFITDVNYSWLSVLFSPGEFIAVSGK